MDVVRIFENSTTPTHDLWSAMRSRLVREDQMFTGHCKPKLRKGLQRKFRGGPRGPGKNSRDAYTRELCAYIQ